MGAHRVACEIGLDLEASVEKAVGGDPPQHHMRVGRRGAFATAPVARRTRLGASALGAHVQGPTRVDPGERAPAGPDRFHIDAREEERHTPLDEQRTRPAAASVDDHRDVRTGAADVNAYEVLLTDELGHPLEGHRATCGPGTRQLHRVVRRLGCGAHTAVALHDQHVFRVAGTRQALGEAVDIGPYARAQVGVGRHGRAPLELAEFLGHLGGGGDEDAGKRRFDPCFGALLVDGVLIGVEEADRDRFDLARAKRFDHVVELSFVEWAHHLPVPRQALVDLEPVAARDERRGRHPLAVVQLLTAGAAHLEGVAKSGGGEKGSPGPASLDQRIRRGGGSVGDVVDLREVDGERGQTVENAEGRVVRGGGHLQGGDPMGLLFHDHEIGKGAADVDPDACSRHG